MTSSGERDYRELLTRAMSALDEMEVKLAASEQRRHEPIAIVGMGLRFPGGANDPESYWDLLKSGRDAVTEIPADRWDVEAMFDPDPDAPGKSYTRWGAFIDDVDKFDAAFFGIAPREALSMDPQQRLLLEVAWQALEQAGIAPPSIAGSETGVFVGISGRDYLDLALQGGVVEEMDAYFGSGTSASIAAGRLAYLLDLHGPTMSIDTACSSALVAMHQACQALRAAECSTAIAGGVNLMLSPDGHIATSRARMMSFEGRCKTFDAAADGYVRGEGCGLLVLKRLSDAVADGSRILAVIRGTHVNQDGRSNGLTAPNAAAQEAVIRAALADGNVEPSAVGFIECHGTGTSLGDPIEVRALQSVFGKGRVPERPLYVQSVKTNIGHLEAAAGIAGLCKLVLCLMKGELPRHLHLSEPNPYIPWRDIAVQPVKGPMFWSEPEGASRIGGISSFGFSGTNAHMVVEQPPATIALKQENTERPHRVYAVSARSSEGLDQLAHLHSMALRSLPEEESQWGDAAFTANAGRAHFDERLAVVATGPEDAARRLVTGPSDEADPNVARGRAREVDDGVVMLFTGQGAQTPGMGRRLYETEPTFRRSLDRCAAIVSEIAGFDLLDVMFNANDHADGHSLHDTRFAQLALFAYEVALTNLWRSWGVEPATVIGHSIGEIAAAHIAGVFSLEDALRLVEARGRLMQQLPRDGGMAAAFAPPQQVKAAIEAYDKVLSIAGFNGPRSTVISGRLDALDTAVAELESSGVRVVRLEVSHAFHSPLMDPMLDEFEAVVSSLELKEPTIDLISNRTGVIAEAGLLTKPSYWREHARQAVMFEDSLRHAISLGHRTFLEVGPAPTLTGMALACELPPESEFVASSRRSGDETLDLQRALTGLYTLGVAIDWRGYEAPWRRSVVSLPTYPFERQSFWHPLARPGVASSRTVQHQKSVEGSLLGRELMSPRLTGRVFEAELSSTSPPWLADHVIYGKTVVPATAYVAMMRGAARATGNLDATISDVQIYEPMVLDEGVPTVAQTAVETLDESSLSLEILSLSGNEWHRHASARILNRPALDASRGSPLDELAQAKARCSVGIGGEEYYAALGRVGVAYGPWFRCIENVQRGNGEAVAVLQAPESHDYELHPVVADACLQLIGLAMLGAGELREGEGQVYLPMGFGSWSVNQAARGRLTAHCRLRTDNGSSAEEVIVGDVDLYADDGSIVATLTEARFKRAPRSSLMGPKDVGHDWLYGVHWRPAPLTAPEGDRKLVGHWIVVADNDGVGAAIRDAIQADGASSTFVDPSCDIAGVLDEIGNSKPTKAIQGIVVVPPDANVRLGSDAWLLTNVVNGLALRSLNTPITVVTRDAVAVVAGDRTEGFEQARAWGVGRVIASEHRDIYCRMVDVSRAGSGSDGPRQVIDELLADDRQDPQVAWRDGVRYTIRLTRDLDDTALRKPDGGYQLDIGERGRLDELFLAGHDERAPEANEVVVQVRASGLNFRDVLNALGRYEGEASSLGSECVGVVSAVGAAVTRFKVGERVMGVTGGSFASSCTISEQMLTAIPDRLSYAQAATIPLVFLTAEYTLNHLAAIRRGERFLIHAATGGVGMAAVQLAQRAGAVVFATAGSEAKRGLLRTMGVEHVYDSRTVSFRDEILRDTDGQGVDIVLNSFTGEALEASVQVLSATGRFVEIGLAGIWDEERFHSVRPQGSYYVFYLGKACLEEPALIAKMLDSLSGDLESGVLKPLPLTTFDLRHADEAFRFMAQAKHVGKVVVMAALGWNIREAGGAWMVSGGTGGLGLVVAGELFASGASRVVLCSRSEPSHEATATIDELRARGHDLRVEQADVADATALSAVVATATADGTRLAGIVHAAGVLDDAMLRDLSQERFEHVMRPKVLGALNLASIAEKHHVDHLIIFSAGAVLFGSPGQGNYAAANSFLDSFAHALHAHGVPAQTINWGPWSDAGMAARLGTDALRRWESQGIVAIEPRSGGAALREVVSRGETQTAVLNLRWPSLLQHFSRQGIPAIAQDLVREEQRRSVPSRESSSSNDLVTELQTLPVERRVAKLRERLQEQVLRVLGLDLRYPVKPRQGLMDLGMDSLMAVELSNRLSVLVDRPLPSTLAFEFPTLDDLATHLQALLSERVEFEKAAEEESVAAPLDNLGLSDLEAALLKELDDAGY